MKTSIRFSKASGSTRRRVEKIIFNGWSPGQRPADFYLSSRRRRLNRMEAGSREF